MIEYLEPHKLATYFPLLEGEEFDQLVNDMKENGQLEPIVIYDGKILDGVNRYRACQVLDIEPDKKEYEGNDPEKYVISVNVRRRHLNESQRVVIVDNMRPWIESKVKEIGGKEAAEYFSVSLETQMDQRHPTDSIIGKLAGASRATGSRMKRIKEQAPDRLPEIMAGRASLGGIEQELREAKARERAQQKSYKSKEKKHQERTREVKVYIDALRVYEAAVFEAIEAVDYGKFSPEAAQYVINRHAKLQNILLGFNDMLEEIKDGLE